MRNAFISLASTKDSALATHSVPVVKCPSDGNGKTVTDGSRSDKYVSRADAGQCNHATGMWWSDTVAPAFKYKYEVVSQVMGLRSGYRVLDWGAGCGHNLDVVAREHGFEGIAIDLVASNAVWADQDLHNLKAFCAADGATLPFPANSFDAVLSNAALFHVP